MPPGSAGRSDEHRPGRFADDSPRGASAAARGEFPSLFDIIVQSLSRRVNSPRTRESEIPKTSSPTSPDKEHDAPGRSDMRLLEKSGAEVGPFGGLGRVV